MKLLRFSPATAEALHARWARMRRKLAFDVRNIERAVGRSWAPHFPTTGHATTGHALASTR